MVWSDCADTLNLQLCLPARDFLPHVLICMLIVQSNQSAARKDVTVVSEHDERPTLRTLIRAGPSSSGCEGLFCCQNSIAVFPSFGL